MPKKYRSVEKDIEAFCGWKFLLDLIERSWTPTFQGIISGLFLTGCRVTELTMLKRENVLLDNPKFIVVRHAPVIKRYSRKTKKKFTAYRTFPIKRAEPLVPYFLKYVEKAGERLYRYSRVRVFQIVRAVGRVVNKPVPFSNIHSSQLYPHWFRAIRARQLRADYGFIDEELRDWFGWKFRAEGMPAIYGKYSWRELVKKMDKEVQYI